MVAPRYEVFFAVQPDADALGSLVPFVHQLKRDCRLSGRPMPADMLHVTLAHVADARGPPPQAVIDLVMESAGRVRAPPFLVKFNRIQGWNLHRRKGPIVLLGDEGVTGLEILHDSIARAMGRNPDRTFTPHLSLIWTPDPIAEDYVEPVSWTVRQFVLIQSVYGQSRHAVLARFPLRL